VGCAAGRPGCRGGRLWQFGDGRQLWAFGRDSWREVKKVVWPTRKETMQMTAYVFAFVAIMSVFLWLTDKTLEWVFFDLILGWRK
jgi:preprotein translocase subunit SecE